MVNQGKRGLDLRSPITHIPRIQNHPVLTLNLAKDTRIEHLETENGVLRKAVVVELAVIIGVTAILIGVLLK